MKEREREDKNEESQKIKEEGKRDQLTQGKKRGGRKRAAKDDNNRRDSVNS